MHASSSYNMEKTSICNPRCLQVARASQVQQQLLFLPLGDAALTFCTCISETTAAGFRCFYISVTVCSHSWGLGDSSRKGSLQDY